jgi:hypothetical protein
LNDKTESKDEEPRVYLITGTKFETASLTHPREHEAGVLSKKVKKVNLYLYRLKRVPGG